MSETRFVAVTIAEAADDPEAAASSTEFFAAQRLAEALLPSHRLRALLEAAGGLPSVALSFSPAQLSGMSLGLTEKQIGRLRDSVNMDLSFKLKERAAALGAWVITYRDPAYPVNLLPLSDAPPLLFVRGNLLADDRFSVAIVGSRRATLYGRAQAERFAQAFAQRGLTVVSGGAAGIDTAAHQGALKEGGRTIAILGCGVDVSYPAENRRLFNEIAERGGAILSEFPLETTPEPWRFPTRNRIIAGMTKASVLIETPDGSGALITARNAVDYGREVWAVPGSVEGGRSRGCHRLIQDGAGLADSPEDVMMALGIAVEEKPAAKSTPKPKAVAPGPTLPLEEKPSPAPPAPVVPATPPPPPANLTPDESKLLMALDLTPQHLDMASAQAGISAMQATVAATLLEMKGLVKRHPGNLFVRVL
jgi:DNA processing protein